MPFAGKILINFSESNFVNPPTFFHQRENGEIRKRISIFEKLYVFDWDDGHFFSLTPTIRIVIDRFLNDAFFDYEVLCNLLLSDEYKEEFDISIQDKLIRNVRTLPSLVRLNINKNDQQSQSKNILLSIENVNDENQPVSCPKFFTNITYDNEKGFLNFFKTKNDSSSFLSRYIHSISKNIPFHKSEISFHPMKNVFNDILNLIENGEEYVYFDNKGFLRSVNLFDLKKLLILIEELYTKNVFKTILSNQERNNLILSISKNIFFDQLFFLKENLEKNNINISSEKIEIKTWSGDINFSREKKDRGWFELNFDISNHDLEVINNADITKGFRPRQPILHSY